MNTTTATTFPSDREKHPALTLITYDSTGAEKKRVNLSGKNILAVVGALLLLLVFEVVGEPALMHFAAKQEAEELHPAMEALAKEGKDDAALWLVKNYLPENKQRLADLAAKGNPEAMYLHGRVLLRSGDIVASEQWIQKSAAEGFPFAVQHVASRDDVGSSRK